MEHTASACLAETQQAAGQVVDQTLARPCAWAGPEHHSMHADICTQARGITGQL